jgi:copper transport protein
MRRVLTVGLAGFALAAVALLTAPAASAHAFLVTSSPGDGAVLRTAPAVLRLDFSESVVLGATSIELIDSSARVVHPTSLSIEQGADTEEPSHLLATLPRLPRSAYRVSWQTLSSDDLHRTSGVFVFGVGTAVHAVPFVEPLPRPEEAALRWAVFTGAAGALGGLLLARFSRMVGADGPLVRRGRRLAACGAAAASVAAVWLLADQLGRSGLPAADLLFGRYGVRWGLREAGLLLLLGAAVHPSRIRRAGQVARAVTVVVGAAGVAIGSALLGHAGADPSLASTRLLADALHLLAAASWVGMVSAAAVLLPKTSGVTARAVLRRFRYPAAVCVAVLTVTGLYLTSSVVGSVDAALVTFYGRVLLVKVGLAAVAALLGLSSYLRLHRGADRAATPRRAVAVEAGVGVLALAAAAVLTAGQPALEPQFVHRSAVPVVPSTTARVVDLQETLAVRPNLPGRNVVLVGVFDTRRPSPAPVREVLVTVGSGRAVAAQPAGDNTWSAPVTIDTTGPAAVTVTVVRNGIADTAHDYAWTVRGGARARPVVVSDTPVASWLRRAALAEALVVLLAAARVVSVARRTRRSRAAENTGSAQAGPGSPAEAAGLVSA